MHEEGDLAIDVGHGAIERFHIGEAILPDIVNEALEDLRLRFDGEDARARTRMGGDEQRIAADIGADVDEDEILA